MSLFDKLRKNVRKVADDIAGDPGESEEAVAAQVGTARERDDRGEARTREELAEPDAARSARDSM